MDRFDNLFKIDLSGFEVKKINDTLPTTFLIDESSLDFRVRTIIRPSILQQTVRVSQTIIMYQEVKKSQFIITEMEVEAIFNCPNLQDQLQEDESISLKLQFRKVLASLTFSTCRGIFLFKHSGTTLDKILLPVMDPERLFGEPDVPQNAETLEL